ncbi:MAG: hypothetical protein F9K23_13710 [Bacteroidetes bacterium]|nr:MAG: hypothetical protein F9K23_13710 [Bacteroidota bacterium]
MALTENKNVISFFSEQGDLIQLSSLDDEKQELDLEAKRLKNEESKLKLTALKEYLEARKDFANLIFTLVCVWLFFILVIVIATGKGNLVLSDTVLVALITTTTINVCGFLYVIAKFLFPSKENPI